MFSIDDSRALYALSLHNNEGFFFVRAFCSFKLRYPKFTGAFPASNPERAVQGRREALQ